MNITRLITILGLIFVGVASRLVPHLPNFNAINSIALFGALYLGSRTSSLSTVWAALLLTDFVFGFHSTMPFVYLSVGLIVMVGYRLKSELTLSTVSWISLADSLLFYFISNFGVWLTTGMYEKSLKGLTMCYVAAIPFLGYRILGDLAYGVAFWAVYSFYMRKSEDCLAT